MNTEDLNEIQNKRIAKRVTGLPSRSPVFGHEASLVSGIEFDSTSRVAIVQSHTLNPTDLDLNRYTRDFDLYWCGSVMDRENSGFSV